MYIVQQKYSCLDKETNTVRLHRKSNSHQNMCSVMHMKWTTFLRLSYKSSMEKQQHQPHAIIWHWATHRKAPHTLFSLSLHTHTKKPRHKRQLQHNHTFTPSTAMFHLLFTFLIALAIVVPVSHTPCQKQNDFIIKK